MPPLVVDEPLFSDVLLPLLTEAVLLVSARDIALARSAANLLRLASHIGIMLMIP